LVHREFPDSIADLLQQSEDDHHEGYFLPPMARDEDPVPMDVQKGDGAEIHLVESRKIPLVSSSAVWLLKMPPSLKGYYWNDSAIS
jgi:hypothetical protein